MLITRSGLVLEKVCEYLYYNERHKDAKDVPDMDIPAELCLELLVAADYLKGTEVKRLLASYGTPTDSQSMTEILIGS